MTRTVTKILDDLQKIAHIVGEENASYEMQKLIMEAQNIINGSQREQVTTYSKKPGYDIWVDGDYRFLYDPINPPKEDKNLEDVGNDIKYDDVVDVGSYGSFKGRNIVK